MARTEKLKILKVTNNEIFLLSMGLTPLLKVDTTPQSWTRKATELKERLRLLQDFSEDL